MVQIKEQREYIQGFTDFVKSFLVTERATINEINLVEANLDLLKARIQTAKECDVPSMMDSNVYD